MMTRGPDHLGKVSNVDWRFLMTPNGSKLPHATELPPGVLRSLVCNVSSVVVLRSLRLHIISPLSSVSMFSRDLQSVIWPL